MKPHNSIRKGLVHYAYALLYVIGSGYFPVIVSDELKLPFEGILDHRKGVYALVKLIECLVCLGHCVSKKCSRPPVSVANI